MDNRHRPPLGRRCRSRRSDSTENQLQRLVRGTSGIRHETPAGNAPGRRTQRSALEHQKVPAQQAEELQIQRRPEERGPVVEQHVEPHRSGPSGTRPRRRPGKRQTQF